MATLIAFRLPTCADIEYLAAHLRASDLAELAAVSDLSPLQAVQASVACSDPEFVFAVFADQHLLAIGGASPTLEPGVAAPWLLATSRIDAHLWTLTRQSRRILALMLGKYSCLSNVIDQRQHGTLRWLQSLGFSLTGTLVYKPGIPLWRFELRS